MNDNMITAMLSMLNQQLLNCVNNGAKFDHTHGFDCVTGGNEGQNAYYRGHFNLAESMAMRIDPSNYIAVDRNGKHSIKRMAW